MAVEKGSRKIVMLRETRLWVIILTAAYVLGCWITDTDIDALVFVTSLGVVGGGHMTANIANGMEHRANA